MQDRAVLAQHWPLFGLEVCTPRLELRYPTDADLVALAERSDDIHDRGFQPFLVPWSLLPDGERERGLFQYHWNARGSWTPAAWRLELVVVVDGEIMGTQGLMGTDFAIRRTVESGSWLHRPQQGQGIGTEMREAVLHLAFAGLGAVRAETCAFVGNHASRRVSQKVGYRPDGTALLAVDGVSRGEERFVLELADWEPRHRTDIEIIGLDPCRELLGA